MTNVLGHFKKNKIDYVSEIDIALAKFNRDNAPSDAQLAECEKHERVFTLRDDEQVATKEAESTSLW